eukprot:UN29052
MVLERTSKTTTKSVLESRDLLKRDFKAIVDRLLNSRGSSFQTYNAIAKLKILKVPMVPWVVNVWNREAQQCHASVKPCYLCGNSKKRCQNDRFYHTRQADIYQVQ